MTQQTGPTSSIVRRWRKILAVGAGATLLLTACASSDGGIADQIGGGDSVSESGDDAPEFLDPSDPDIARASVLADQLVGELGDDDTAAEALLAAFAAGYSSPQVLGAVEANTLLADGTVSGVEPDGVPVDLTDVEPKRRRGRAARAADEPLPIERLRERARLFGGENDNNVGNHATLAIIVLAILGLSPEEIVEVLVLGEVEYVRNGVCYRTLIDRLPARCEAGPDDETAPAATVAPDPTTASETPSPASEGGGANLPDGAFRGPIDLTGYFEAIAPEVAPYITVANSEMVVVIEQGVLTSLSGSAQTSNPEVEVGDGAFCGTELKTWTFESSGAGASAIEAGIVAPTTMTVTGTGFCTDTNGDVNTVPGDFSVTLSATVTAISGTGGLAVTLGIDGISVGITATLE